MNMYVELVCMYDIEDDEDDDNDNIIPFPVP